MTTGIVANDIKYRRRPHTQSIVWRRSNVRAGVHSRSILYRRRYNIVAHPRWHHAYRRRFIGNCADLTGPAPDSFYSPSEFVRFTRRFYYTPYPYSIRSNETTRKTRDDFFSVFVHIVTRFKTQQRVDVPDVSSITRDELNGKINPLPQLTANPKKHRMFQTEKRNTLIEGHTDNHPKIYRNINERTRRPPTPESRLSAPAFSIARNTPGNAREKIGLGFLWCR